MPQRDDPRFTKMLAQLRGDDERTDGWANFFQGIGVRGRDASLGDRITPPVELDRTSLEFLYRGDAIAARAVDVLPDDATRQGWELKIDRLGNDADVDPEKGNEIADGVADYLRGIEGRKRIRKGLTLGRLFGGGLGVMGIDDGSSSDLGRFAEPVDETQIKSVRWLQVLERWQVVPGEIETDPTKSGFGEPRTWKLHGLAEKAEAVEVHNSRVLRFRGMYSPTRSGSAENDQWDDSVLTRIWDPLSRFEMAYASTARVVRDFSRAVYAIKNLHRHIASNREDVVRRRIEIAEMSFSALNAMLIDPDGERFEMLQRPVTGLPELLDRLGMLLAAATGMPITLLLGLSPGGFGTGEDEDRRWSNVVQAYQEDQVLPVVEKLTRYILLAKDGPTEGSAPEKWSVNFNPLKAPSEKEAAEIRKIVAEAYTGLVTAGVLLEEEVAEGLFGRGEFNMDVALDRQARDEMREAEARDPQDPGELDPNDPTAALLGAQRERETLEQNADAILAVLERVDSGNLTPDTGARVLNRLYGFPLEEAEHLTAAA